MHLKMTSERSKRRDFLSLIFFFVIFKCECPKQPVKAKTQSVVPNSKHLLKKLR